MEVVASTARPRRLTEGKRGRRSVLIAIAVTLLLAAGCGVSPAQRRRVARLEADAAALGHPEVKYVEHLDPQRAAALGFAPFGLAGFYVKRTGLGISGLLLWPISILWLPGMAEASAYAYNHAQLEIQVRKLLDAAKNDPPVPAPQTGDVLDTIERLYRDGKITAEEREEMRRRALKRVVD